MRRTILTLGALCAFALVFPLGAAEDVFSDEWDQHFEDIKQDMDEQTTATEDHIDQRVTEMKDSMNTDDDLGTVPDDDGNEEEDLTQSADSTADTADSEPSIDTSDENDETEAAQESTDSGGIGRAAAEEEGTTDDDAADEDTGENSVSASLGVTQRNGETEVERTVEGDADTVGQHIETGNGSASVSQSVTQQSSDDGSTDDTETEETSAATATTTTEEGLDTEDDASAEGETETEDGLVLSDTHIRPDESLQFSVTAGARDIVLPSTAPYTIERRMGLGWRTAERHNRVLALVTLDRGESRSWTFTPSEDGITGIGDGPGEYRVYLETARGPLTARFTVTDGTDGTDDLTAADEQEQSDQSDTTAETDVIDSTASSGFGTAEMNRQIATQEEPVADDGEKVRERERTEQDGDILSSWRIKETVTETGDGGSSGLEHDVSHTTTTS